MRWLYVGTLLAATVATACLIAPVSHHRILFRQHRKPHLVMAANRLAHAGLAALLLAVLGAVFLVVDVVTSIGVAVGLVGALAALFIVTWYLQPLRLRRRERQQSDL
jgi:Flp pilus assembly protein TadB